MRMNVIILFGTFLIVIMWTLPSRVHGYHFVTLVVKIEISDTQTYLSRTFGMF